MDVVKSFFQIIEGITKVSRAVTNTSSLIDRSKAARVEPITVISRDLKSLDYMPDVMQTVLNVFTSYYLQAIPSGCTVGSVEVNKILSSVNPETNVGGNFADSLRIIANEEVNDFGMKYKLAIEDDQDKEPKGRKSGSGSAFDGKNQAIVTTNTNLAVGKLIEVNINYTDADKKPITAKVPVTVRLAAVEMSNQSLVNMLAREAEDIGFIERYHAWRSGRISLIRDLVFCVDLVEERKKAMIKDETGVYQEILRRARNKKSEHLVSLVSDGSKANIPMNVASNLFVISEEVAKELEYKAGGKLSQASVRKRIFDGTYGMLLVVVNRDWKRVTIYSRGIALGTEFSISEIKGNAKSSGPDIVDVLKAMQLGNAPSF